MKAKIAVATVSGKAYYLIVNELRKKNIPFISLIPNEPIPVEVKVVVTTKEEQHLINHEKILVYQDETELTPLINEAVQIVHGKEFYEKIVIGIDPGEVCGLAVLADGKIIETENCFNIQETLNKVKNVLRGFEKNQITSFFVKVGDGVPAYRENLLRVLDNALPQNVILESVSEAGTNRHLSETKHRRGLRDIVSAVKIAGRNGQQFPRGKINE
jgi:hypothetical protein